MAPVPSTPRAAVRTMAVYAAAAAVFGAFLVVLKLFDVDVRHLVSDVRDAVPDGDRVPGWAGAVSNVGLLAWGVAAGACLTAAAALPDGEDGSRRFLAATGALFLVVGIDDAILFHEVLAPGYLGVPELAVNGAVALLVATWIVRFRPAVARSDWVLLVLAAGAFALSSLIDKVPGRSITVEEYFKYVGLGGFAAWAVSTSVAAVRRAYRPASAGAPTSG